MALESDPVRSEGILRHAKNQAVEQDEEWLEGMRYLNMDFLREHRKEQLRELQLA